MATPKAVPGVTRSQVLAALQRYIDSHDGLSPSVRELAGICGIGSSACYSHLTQLMVEGKVREVPGQARSLRVVADSKAVAE